MDIQQTNIARRSTPEMKRTAEQVRDIILKASDAEDRSAVVEELNGGAGLPAATSAVGFFAFDIDDTTYLVAVGQVPIGEIARYRHRAFIREIPAGDITDEQRDEMKGEGVMRIDRSAPISMDVDVDERPGSEDEGEGSGDDADAEPDEKGDSAPAKTARKKAAAKKTAKTEDAS